MNPTFKRPIAVFLVLVVLIALPLFLFPINLFQGEEVRVHEVFGKQVEVVNQVPLSLSYFIGLGYDEADLVGVKDFYLKPQGILLAFILIFGIPALMAYRVHLNSFKKEDPTKK